VKETKFGQNFFESTRGRIVNLLRRGVDTVEDLSRRLHLTDNAVRAHLATLARDGLVERRGERRGFRKPHFTYALTPDAEQLFPKAYHTLLNQLLLILKQRLEPNELQEILSEVARSLAAPYALQPESGESAEARAGKGLEVLESLGGAAKVEASNEGLFIKSTGGCPFSSTVSDHPEVCRLAEVLLSEITGLEVRENCRRGEKPSCVFEILSPTQN
jgi:predicted ArsR family transcriptional regulator